jgi:hypothetical protein
MKQEERIKLYQNFKDFKHRILVSTDIWGRGIDIERVSRLLSFPHLYRFLPPPQRFLLCGGCQLPPSPTL